MAEERKESCLKANQSKLVAVFVLILIVVYVVIDQVTKGCTEVQTEDARYTLVLCDAVTGPKVKNATANGVNLFLCPSDKSPWTAEPPALPTRCVRPGACVTAGVRAFLDWIGTHVFAGVFVFTGTYVLATVCFVPGLLLTLGAGATFAAALGLGPGVLVATISVWVGANIGAAIAFLLGRHILRDWVSRMIEKFTILVAIDRAIDQNGFLTVLLLRFSPIIPFNVFNYVMGATGVSLKHYIAASTMGMLPGTVGYVFIGAAIASASTRDPEDVCSNSDNAIRRGLLIGGIIMTIVAVGFISWYAKRNLDAILKAQELVAADPAEQNNQITDDGAYNLHDGDRNP